MATSEPLARRTIDMGVGGVVLALFTCGYIIGVWTALAVSRQPQRLYEDGAPVNLGTARVVVGRGAGVERRL